MWTAIISAGAGLATVALGFLFNGDFHTRWRDSIQKDVVLLNELPEGHPAREPLSRAIDMRVRVYVRRYFVRDDPVAERNWKLIRRDRAYDVALRMALVGGLIALAGGVASNSDVSHRLTDAVTLIGSIVIALSFGPLLAGLLLAIEIKRLPPPPET